MKKTRVCPKCDSGNVVHLRTVRDFTDVHLSSTDMALRSRAKFLGVEKVAVLEAYVCNACGYVEFYVKDLPLSE